MKSAMLMLFSIISLLSFAQKDKSPYPKFGKISATELQTKLYSIDSNANAVILSDVGSTEITGNSNGWFSFVTKRHTIIHVLNKNAYDEAIIKIPLYVDGRREETVTGLKGITYNLENGKIIESKLEKQSQFSEKIDENHKVLKFTMPQVKEGSIIEFQYTINSDFISVLDPWYFQSLTAPTLWSEFVFTVPSFFSYNYLNRGYLPLFISERADRTSNFTVSDQNSAINSQRTTFQSGVTDFRWVVKNAPELKTENYTHSVRNHISRMEFQLSAYNQPLTPRSFRSTWQEVTKGLLESESFGEKLNANNNWMADEVKPLYNGITNDTEKAVRIFEYVRDNFKWSGKYGVYLNQTLRNVFKTKQGSVPEINLLLTAMLRYAGLDAHPVLLSTVGNGYSFEFSPMVTGMNYLVVQYNDINASYYLDASQPRLGFDRLPLYCYNGHSRIVNFHANPVYFNSDSLKESKSTTFYIANLDNGKWGGSVSQHPGFYESYDLRNEITEDGREAFFKEIQKNYGATATLLKPEIDSLDKYELPVSLRYQLEFSNDDEDILYINPLFGEGYKSNPFTAAERYYPVEMPFAQNEMIIATLEVPKGYTVDELPKQMRVNFDPEGKSFFEYLISQSGNIISFRNRISLNKALFMPEEYPALREFFNLVVKKQSEQIVFKKTL